MKLKLILLSTVLCAVLSSATFANKDLKKNPAKDVYSVLKEFTSGMITTDAKKLSNIFRDDALVKFCKGSNVVTNKPSEIINHLKANNGLIQNCEYKIEVLNSNNTLTLAKVDLIYADFSIENYVTLELDKNANWKITGINKFYTKNTGYDILTSN